MSTRSSCWSSVTKSCSRTTLLASGSMTPSSCLPLVAIATATRGWTSDDVNKFRARWLKTDCKPCWRRSAPRVRFVSLQRCLYNCNSLSSVRSNVPPPGMNTQWEWQSPVALSRPVCDFRVHGTGHWFNPETSQSTEVSKSILEHFKQPSNPDATWSQTPAVGAHTTSCLDNGLLQCPVRAGFGCRSAQRWTPSCTDLHESACPTTRVESNSLQQ